MEPARKPDYDIKPDTRPDLRVIEGGGETTPDRPARGNLRAVSDAEQQGDFKPGAGGEPSVREQEQEGDNIDASPIRSIYSGAKNGKQKLTRAQITRRVGLIGGGGGIIGIALFFISGFLPLGGILLNLGETATANRDTQNTILSKRLYKVIDSKIGGDMTTGSCNIIKIACRFSRPSNALLSRLSDNGIEAIGKDGTPIKKTLLGFPNEKPTTYRFKGNDIPAPDFVKTLGTNSEFRKAFTTAYNMRYWGYADSVIKKLFYSKEGIDRSGKTTDGVDSKNPEKSIQSIADGAEGDNAVKNAASEDAARSAATSEIEDIAAKEAQSAAKRIAKSGDPVLMAAGAACVAVNVPGMFANAVRLYQMRQEIVLASTLVLTASSMLKAGDMSPETMATIGTLLTATAVLANGTKTKSAMDASGLKAVIFGDNTSAASDASLAKVIPGKSAIDATKGISAFANSDAVKTGCAAINSPEAQVIAGSIEGAIGATGVGGAIVGILKAGTWAAIKLGGFQAMIDLATPLIKQGVGALIAAIPAATIMSIFGNQDIAKAQNEDLGNVLGGGLSFFYSNATLATGTGAPLTTGQLADYQKETQDTMIAYAEQDREGRSPLDVSSPYTFLGSIVSNYYKYAYVPNNVMQTVLSSIGYTLSQPLKMLTTNTYAAANDMTALYSHASEFGVDPSVAVGPYGDLATGMPTQFSNASTADVYNTVSSQVDENSGQPNSDSDIQSMLNDCGDGSLLNAAGCTITNQNRADESLYLSDLRINDMLDGTNTDQDSSSSAGAGSTTVDEANLFTDSTSIACAPGTEDAGNDTGYSQGKPIPIHLCKLPNTYLTDKNTPGLVNARASGVALAMFDQMKKDLGLSTVALNDSFRTMAEQVQARAQYGTQAAEPGYSNHQMGFAFDINMGSANGGNSSSYSAGVNTSYPGNPVWEWLKAHASTYHFSQYSREGWHWSIDGR